MNLKEVRNLISSVANSGANELKLNYKDVKIEVKIGKEQDGLQKKTLNTGNDAFNLQYGVPKKQEELSPKSIINLKKNIVKSLFIGTFVKREQFLKINNLEVGDIIRKGDVLCAIESLNLKNELRSDFSGEIIDILVKDNSPVDFDQPLFVIAE